MNILWEADSPCIISDILKADPSLSRNSVAKLLVKLTECGCIEVDGVKKTVTRFGKAYTPVISKHDYMIQKDYLEHLVANDSTCDSALYLVRQIFAEGLADADFAAQLSQQIQEYKQNKAQ